MTPSRPGAPSATDLYARYRQAVKDERLPLALVDLDAVDHNVGMLLEGARAGDASAGFEVRALPRADPPHRRSREGVVRIMAYTVEEGAFLTGKAAKRVRVSSVQPSDARIWPRRP
jgi:D-serine deaminase-like pyridoxal phosphate-dependent protein